jgi:hypothetical protein
MKRLSIFVAVVLAAGVVATAGSGSTARSGALHVTKECPQYQPVAGSFCTIRSSNIAAIKAGMKVVYLQAPGSVALESDIVVSFPGGDSAGYGHVWVNNTTGVGRVTLRGGTGAFAGLRVEAAVSVDEHGIWHWDGTYSYGG